jgi:hypothetical protein
MQKGYSLKSKALAIVMALALSHISLIVAWAAPQITGKLITSGNLPITVNGNSSQGGSSILSGAVVETPDNVSATIQIGDLGEVELAPGTLAVIEFTGNNVKVTLKRGCAALTTNKGTTGSVVNDQNKVYATNSSAEEGVVGDPDYARLNSVQAQSDGSKRRRLPVCGVLFSGAPPVAGPVPPAVGGGGLSGAAIGAILAGIGGAAIIGGIIGFGGDASPSSPRR